MQKIIVTGHSRGLGAALADSFLKRGIAVLGLSRGSHPVLRQRYGSLIQEVEIDLSDTEALSTYLASEAWTTYCENSAVLGLVNNAGTVQPMGALGTQGFSEISKAVALNVTAPLLLSQAVVMMGGERRILHISSGAGRHAYPGWSVYCATKAALDQHAQAVALDKVQRVRVCSLAPGIVDTDMQAEIRGASVEKFSLSPQFQSFKDNGQLSSPTLCAEKIATYFLSEQFGTSVIEDIRTLVLN